MTRSEYDKLVEEIAAAEQERLEEALNAIFDREGRNYDALTHMLTSIVENQTAVAARVVTGILDGIGILPKDA